MERVPLADVARLPRVRLRESGFASSKNNPRVGGVTAAEALIDGPRTRVSAPDQFIVLVRHWGVMAHTLIGESDLR